MIIIAINSGITNILYPIAPSMSPCISLCIPLVRPHAGHWQSANSPLVGHTLNSKGNNKCLNTHLNGEYGKIPNGAIASINRIIERLKTMALGEPKLNISKKIFFNSFTFTCQPTQCLRTCVL